jgi:hypothetical protein
MWLEHRIDIAGDAGSVVGQGHSGVSVAMRKSPCMAKSKSSLVAS